MSSLNNTNLAILLHTINRQGGVLRFPSRECTPPASISQQPHRSSRWILSWSGRNTYEHATFMNFYTNSYENQQEQTTGATVIETAHNPAGGRSTLGSSGFTQTYIWPAGRLIRHLPKDLPWSNICLWWTPRSPHPPSMARRFTIGMRSPQNTHTQNDSCR